MNTATILLAVTSATVRLVEGSRHIVNILSSAVFAFRGIADKTGRKANRNTPAFAI